MTTAGEQFVRHDGGLLVPAGVVGDQAAEAVEALGLELAAARDLAVAQQAEHRTAMATLVQRAAAELVLPQPAGVVDVDDAGEAARLRAELTGARDLVAVRAEDVWARRAQAVEHRIAMADVDDRAAAVERARRERARDAAEADALAVLYRRATRSGARARIRAEISGSAEMRALRVAAVRRVALVAGLPVLAAFAAWSTTGVQAGVVRLLHLGDASAAWWASWAVEPALITVVALIIIGRAVLRASGGDTDWRATLAEWSALSLSLALNIVGGWPGGGFWSGLGSALPHAIGPLGCAGTAFLIGLFDGYVSAARPWHGAPRLADLDLTAPVGPAAHSPATHGRDAVGAPVLRSVSRIGGHLHRLDGEPTHGPTHGPVDEPARGPVGAPGRGEPARPVRGEPGDPARPAPAREPRRPGHEPGSYRPALGAAPSPSSRSRSAVAAAGPRRVTVTAPAAGGSEVGLGAAYAALVDELHREPSGAELAARAGVSKATANRWKSEHATRAEEQR